MCQDDLANDKTLGDWVAFAIALANTWDIWLADPEKLRDPAALNAFLSEQGVTRNGPVTDQDLDDVRSLRDALRAVFRSESARDAAQGLAAILDGVLVQPRILTSDLQSDDAVLAYVPLAQAALVDRVRALAGLGTATALERWGVARLHTCDAERCEDVFVDTSRNGKRRYCGVRCQNRVNVAALRQRAHQPTIGPS
jgi:predicted RNA-binding Zn ribbon-like protein